MRIAYTKWVESHSPLVIAGANNARRALARKLKSPRREALIPDERIPKRPLSAYLLFNKDRYASGDLKHIDTLAARNNLVKDEWNALRESEKQVCSRFSSSQRFAISCVRLDLSLLTLSNSHTWTKPLLIHFDTSKNSRRFSDETAKAPNLLDAVVEDCLRHVIETCRYCALRCIIFLACLLSGLQLGHHCIHTSYMYLLGSSMTLYEHDGAERDEVV